MNLLSAIGSTPLIELNNLNGNSKVRIFGKLEGNNPGGSIKDRPAYYMIKKAEESGELTREKTILEPTSGNTGIAMAMIGAVKGYKVKHYMPNQFENENNVLAHYETTGPEIFSQTKGEIDVFVAGMGTGGTLMGVAKYLKERKPEIKIVGVEPIVGHKIQGLKNMQESIVPKIYHSEKLDEKIIIEDDPAYEMTRLLATKEGIFVGMSSGAAVVGALRIAKKMHSGIIVVILPDRGDRYLSTALFRSTCGKCPP